MRRALTFALLALLPACATPKPTQALVDARAAIQRAKSGKANKLAPARVLTAEKKLEEAEQAFKDEPGSKKEKHSAYLAMRLAELAEAHASLRAARKMQENALSSYMDSQDAARRQQKAELRRRRKELEDLESRLKAAKGNNKKLAKLREELEKKKANLQKSLEAERKARQAAEQKAAAALGKLQEIAKIKEAQEETIITLSGSVLFTSGKSALLPVARQKLKQVVIALKAQQKSRKMLIKGHTDSRGSKSRNRELSRLRAEAVRDFLIEQGLDANRITAVGKGASEPVATNRTAEGRANNRRVEIVLKKAH
ncbi:MAG: OmpA family protein [Myxococcales bacterium]|nr:OmpA family protein [Myxococcales bacterium]